MAQALISIPAAVKAGDVIEIRALLRHPMETGFRPGDDGKLLPRDIVRTFVCLFDNREVFRAELHPAIAANPYITFTLRATESGFLAFTWEGDNGFAQTETRRLVVT